MKKKNWLALLMAGAMLAGALTGCGKKEEDNAGDGALKTVTEGKLTVAISPDFAPTVFVDPSREGQDQYVGTDVSLIRFIADELGLELKPFQYELDFEPCQTDLDLLLAYLRENLAPGEEVELWSLWVGSGGGRVRHYRGRLSEFDLDTLGMLTETQYEPDLTGEFPDGLICQVCLTVEI